MIYGNGRSIKAQANSEALLRVCISCCATRCSPDIYKDDRASATPTACGHHERYASVTENVLKIAGPVLEALKDPKIEPYFRLLLDHFYKQGEAHHSFPGCPHALCVCVRAGDI
ncbi:hypothetical protein BJV77DRAFT_1004779 [Russula vinacea]|nr:hypothetical protein BJV77DRAFT_1004779 [Russula vinacea]